MPRVFIIQNSAGKNFEPAKHHGEITIILRGSETIDQAEIALADCLTRFKPEDFLLLVGSPVFIIMAALLAWQELIPGEPLKTLVWDKEHYQYNVVEIDLPGEETLT